MGEEDWGMGYRRCNFCQASSCCIINISVKRARSAPHLRGFCSSAVWFKPESPELLLLDFLTSSSLWLLNVSVHDFAVRTGQTAGDVIRRLYRSA